MTRNELALLEELADYRVCSEDADPRGWEVIASDNVGLGTVADLIVDLTALTARYIVCADGGRAVLIPTGFARLDNERCTVHLDFVTAADVAKLPAFTGLPVTEAHAAQLEAALTGAAETTSPSKGRIVRRDAPRNAS